VPNTLALPQVFGRYGPDWRFFAAFDAYRGHSISIAR